MKKIQKIMVSVLALISVVGLSSYDFINHDIINTVEEINSKEREYKNSEDENIFWQEVTDADEFRLQNLCGYSRKLHKPLDKFLKDKELFKEQEADENDDEDDLFMKIVDKTIKDEER